MEHIHDVPKNAQERVEQNYVRLLSLEPKMVTNTVPHNASEAKEAFILSDTSQSPDHVYGKLEQFRWQNTSAELAECKDYFAQSQDVPAKERAVYLEFVASYQKKTRLLELMHDVHEANSAVARAEFMQLNRELYGEPQKEVYHSLLSEQLAPILDKQLGANATAIRDELVAMMPIEAMDTANNERFIPSDETQQWMQQAAQSLYEPWLERMPADKDTYTAQDLQELFTTILREEIGEAAAQWRVDIEPAKSINVKSPEQRVVIPADRGEMSRLEVKRLLVHELGVHVLRSLSGESTDLGPLRTGLSEYYDAEEGLGKVMEQAVAGQYAVSGEGHYITAGYAYHETKNFRQVYDMKWRLGLLWKLKDGDEVTASQIDSAKSVAYGNTMRIMRGTDSLPWFKDLAYYRGTEEVWKYLERIRGDDLQLSLLLQGKVNTSKQHQRVMLESHSV